jgi:hypothetical protein
MLSPFDNPIVDRARAHLLVDLHCRIEAYTPRAKRRYGCYAMPVVVGTGSSRGSISELRPAVPAC